MLGVFLVIELKQYQLKKEIVFQIVVARLVLARLNLFALCIE
jgi:hypothetical protein